MNVCVYRVGSLSAVVDEILEKGEFQITEKERKVMLEAKTSEVQPCNQAATSAPFPSCAHGLTSESAWPPRRSSTTSPTTITSLGCAPPSSSTPRHLSRLLQSHQQPVAAFNHFG